jgi:hypothetical protein
MLLNFTLGIQPFHKTRLQMWRWGIRKSINSQYNHPPKTQKKAMLESIPTYCELGGNEESRFLQQQPVFKTNTSSTDFIYIFHPSHHSCLQHVTVISCSMSKYVILLRYFVPLFRTDILSICNLVQTVNKITWYHHQHWSFLCNTDILQRRQVIHANHNQATKLKIYFKSCTI